MICYKKLSKFKKSRKYNKIYKKYKLILNKLAKLFIKKNCKYILK